MPKLPTNGELNWGNTLNEFLEVSQVNDNTSNSGKIKIEALKTNGEIDANKVLSTNNDGSIFWENINKFRNRILYGNTELDTTGWGENEVNTVFFNLLTHQMKMWVKNPLNNIYYIINDNSFNIGNGFNGPVNNITVDINNKILVGGAFTSYNSFNSQKIIRLDFNLSSNSYIDYSFSTKNGFDGVVYSILPKTDGKILVGGSFTNYENVSNNNIIQLNSDGTKDYEYDFASGFNNTVYTIKSLGAGDNETILVGGAFTSYRGEVKNYISRLKKQNINSNNEYGWQLLLQGV